MAPKQPVAGPSRPKNTPTSAAPLHHHRPLPARSTRHLRSSPWRFLCSVPPIRSPFGTSRRIRSSRNGMSMELARSRQFAGHDDSLRRQEEAQKARWIDRRGIRQARGSGRHHHRARPGLHLPSHEGCRRQMRLAIQALAAWTDERGVFLSTSSAILLLAVDTLAVKHTFALPPNTPSPTALAVMPRSSGDKATILASADSVVSLDVNLSSGKVLSHLRHYLSQHLTSLRSRLCLERARDRHSSLAADDRTVSQYTFAPNSATARLSYRYASPTVSPVHSVNVSPAHLSVLHASARFLSSLCPPLSTSHDLSRTTSLAPSGSSRARPTVRLGYADCVRHGRGPADQVASLRTYVWRRSSQVAPSRLCSLAAMSTPRLLSSAKLMT